MQERLYYAGKPDAGRSQTQEHLCMCGIGFIFTI